MTREEFLANLGERFGCTIQPGIAHSSVLGSITVHYSPYSQAPSEIIYETLRAKHEWQPIERKGLPVNYLELWMKIQILLDHQAVYHMYAIRKIRQHIIDLGSIRRCNVEYIEHFDRAEPRAVCVLRGTDLELFGIFGHGIKYEPSKRSGYDGRGSYTWAATVADIVAKPFEEFERKPAWRCHSHLMDMFVSENVRFVPEDNLGDNEQGRRRGTILIGDEVAREV